MNRRWIAVAGAWLLSACGARDVTVTSPGKVEGPDIPLLSRAERVSLYQACTRYGRIDDPRVPYSASYCAAVQNAQLLAGDSAPASAKVDPAITPLH